MKTGRSIHCLLWLLVLTASFVLFPGCDSDSTTDTRDSNPVINNDTGTDDQQTSTSGTLDEDFYLYDSGLHGTVNYIKLLPDGSFYAGGINPGSSHFAAPSGIMKFNSDGTVDETFNPGGDGALVNVNVVHVLDSGKILLAGNINQYNLLSLDLNIMRINSDGSWDGTFNSGGSGPDTQVNCMLVLPDESILIGGRITTYHTDDTPDGLMKLTIDGTVDEDFNTGGAGFTIQNIPYTTVSALAVQPDGNILVGGRFTAYNGETVPNGIIRLTPTGAIDPDFNPGGSCFDDPDATGIYGIKVCTDGKIFVCGAFETYNGSQVPNGIMRLNSDGTVDTTFNPGTAGFTGTVYQFEELADGKKLACGYFTHYNGETVPKGIVRLNSDWSLDETFNQNNVSIVYGYFASFAVRSDGKIILGGFFDSYNGIDITFPLIQILP